MQRKKLDSRISTLINNGVESNHRTFFVLVGDRGKDQVVTLHFLLSKARIAARPNVLWCYKKDLGFTSHREKRAKQIKSQIARGIKNADEDDPFELFVTSTNVRYTYYKETEKILGNTYGMCVLQDFEAVTPNILARTIETVEGGGIVVLLLRTMSSLKQLYTLTMDVHARYRTESHHDTVARFNERFILSLGNCETCLFMDDELNVLPLSVAKTVKAIAKKESSFQTPEMKELQQLKDSLQDTQPIGSLIACTKTLDQAKALLNFVEAAAEKTLRSTISLTSARGRGKSATLGISLASAVAYGYSNIFITSPSPENLKTLFEFVFKGFDALGYEEHQDYDIIKSTNPAFQNAVVRVNIHIGEDKRRQTIQYIQPQDYKVLEHHAELLVIDEAAAIPLPVVRNLLGPYLVFMASTINGYEGTGRSLSLKLLKQLREQSQGAAAKDEASLNRSGKLATVTPGSRILREITLQAPIRYGVDDPVESWLNKLLCLDCCNPATSTFSNKLLIGNGPTGCPHPSSCELFYVNRDTLFSFHPVGEAFLQRMMSLYVASHYKNSPNDLQLMSDAPAHHLFVLLPPTLSSSTTLPDPLVVVQVCLEGSISKQSALASLAKGTRNAGDLIPWVMSQQFQDDDFASLNGARIVRIATHPDYIGMGYGARAVQLVEEYYSGKFVSLDEGAGDDEDLPKENVTRINDTDLENGNLMNDKIGIRDASSMPPLLLRLSERPLKSAERLNWIGVSYGLTSPLHKFWKRAGFVPLYIRQTTNEITGEHSCIMLKAICGGEVGISRPEWLHDFAWDFRRRLVELLAYDFKKFSPITVLSILEAVGASREGNNELSSSRGADAVVIDSKLEVSRSFTPFDLKRLESYTSNLLDYHVIIDLSTTIAHHYFLGRYNPSERVSGTIKPVKLSPVQAAIILGIGLQKKSVTDLEKELGLPSSQILALFGKTVKKCVAYLDEVVEMDVKVQVEEESIRLAPVVVDLKRRNPEDEAAWDPTAISLDADLEEGGEQVMGELKARQKELVASWDLSGYEIGGTDEDWSRAKMGKGSKIVNVPSELSSKKRKLTTGAAAELASKNSGEKTGMVDPGNLMGTKKTKGGKSRKKK